MPVLDSAEPAYNDRERGDVMPQIVSDIFKEDLLLRNINFKTDVINVALMTSKHRYNADDTYWCNVRHNEVEGQGYESGGQTLRNAKFKRGYKTICITGDNMLWNCASFTMQSIVLYFKNNGKIIGTTGFMQPKTVNDAMFTAMWDSQGIISEYLPDEPPQYLTYYFEKGDMV